MVFCGLYPIDGDEFPELREALDKLRLNDSSFTFQPETSGALGFGFRCGFLGPAAHGDRPRAPRARVRPEPHRHGPERRVHRAPHRRRRAGGRQPVRAAAGGRDRVASRSRSSRSRSSRPPTTRARSWSCARPGGARCASSSTCRPSAWSSSTGCPLAEVVIDFFDQMKSRTQGYASLDYEPDGLRGVEPGEGRHPPQRRARRRLLDDRAPRPRPTTTAGG